jgi:hypothetical protein
MLSHLVKLLMLLMWWKINSGKFSVLSEVALYVLAIPITTIASESSFSIGGCVIDHFWSSLAPKRVVTLICTQNWLRYYWISEHDELLLLKMKIATSLT